MFDAEALRRTASASIPALIFGLRLSASVCLALYIAFWLQIDGAYWAGTSAGIVCQPSLGASLRKGWFRMIGTVVGAAFVLPGPGWLPAALLLPSLALCVFALAAATVLEPRAAAVTAGALWTLPVLLLAAAHVPLAIVQPNAQFAWAAVLCAAVVVLLARHDRFEWGWKS